MPSSILPNRRFTSLMPVGVLNSPNGVRPFSALFCLCSHRFSLSASSKTANPLEILSAISIERDEESAASLSVFFLPSVFYDILRSVGMSFIGTSNTSERLTTESFGMPVLPMVRKSGW